MWLRDRDNATIINSNYIHEIRIKAYGDEWVLCAYGEHDDYVVEGGFKSFEDAQNGLKIVLNYINKGTV